MKNNSFIIFTTIMLSSLVFTAKGQKTDEIYYTAKLPSKSTSEMLALLERYLIGTKSWDGYNNPSDYPKKVSVFDDRFELTWKKKDHPNIFPFTRLAGQPPIKIIQIKNNTPGQYNGFTIRLGGLTFNAENNLVFLKGLADCLFYFQYQVNEKQFNSDLTVFEPIASQYRALEVKPAVSEEQRKYIVQANLFSQKKDYEKAIELYNKAIAVDQTAYPSAYSNLALLSSQIEKYYAAIYYMKKYLLLEPEAADARSAQDKIYEWEALIGK